LQEAEKYLPTDPRLKQIVTENTITVSITSEPSGATVEIQDYSTPAAAWHRLGVTPLAGSRIPKGYFRWKVAKAGTGEWLMAPETKANMDFALGTAVKTPEMGLVPGGTWADYVDFVGWLGPYVLPPYYIDRYEVTNREYQKFVDNGGYDNRQYWRERLNATATNSRGRMRWLSFGIRPDAPGLRRGLRDTIPNARLIFR
jgi:eukaryotic-like serine/threonine-protein kinase